MSDAGTGVWVDLAKRKNPDAATSSGGDVSFVDVCVCDSVCCSLRVVALCSLCGVAAECFACSDRMMCGLLYCMLTIAIVVAVGSARTRRS